MQRTLSTDTVGGAAAYSPLAARPKRRLAKRIMQKKKQKEDRDWLHGARVPRAGPLAELWTHSRTAPGRGCAEVCVCVPCEAQGA